MSESIWRKLERSKEYREAFVGAQVKRSVPFQIRTLRKQRGWSQNELAERAGLTQGVVSRAENPDYGNLALNTIVRIAAGFDCGLLLRFVPFSGLVDWHDSLSESTLRVPSFSADALSGWPSERSAAPPDITSRDGETTGIATRIELHQSPGPRLVVDNPVRVPREWFRQPGSMPDVEEIVNDGATNNAPQAAYR